MASPVYANQELQAYPELEMEGDQTVQRVTQVGTAIIDGNRYQYENLTIENAERVIVLTKEEPPFWHKLLTGSALIAGSTATSLLIMKAIGIFEGARKGALVGGAVAGPTGALAGGVIGGFARTLV